MLLVLTTNMAAVTSCATSNWNQVVLIFKELGKQDHPRKNSWGRKEKQKQPQTTKGSKKKKLRTPACPLGK